MIKEYISPSCYEIFERLRTHQENDFLVKATGDIREELIRVWGEEVKKFSEETHDVVLCWGSVYMGSKVGSKKPIIHPKSLEVCIWNVSISWSYSGTKSYLPILYFDSIKYIFWDFTIDWCVDILSMKNLKYIWWSIIWSWVWDNYISWLDSLEYIWWTISGVNVLIWDTVISNNIG